MDRSKLVHSSRSFSSCRSGSSCHSHNLEYVSSANPAESETFLTLRRATIRTLSGEQLPRGQTSGPLWFGDPFAGYTIAYVFRLGDLHARGRQRYYALLALAGLDTQRAFGACSIIWSRFEQIAFYIVNMAEDVALRLAEDDGPPEMGRITPVSSFLTGRTLDPEGLSRQGPASIRANGIAELVDNENFFCELHVMFVGIFQTLGRVLGGMSVTCDTPMALENSNNGTKSNILVHEAGAGERSSGIKNKSSVHLSSTGREMHPTLQQCPSPLCTLGFVPHRQQVAV